MRAALIAGIAGTVVTCAHGAYIETLIFGSSDYTYTGGETLEYSIWLRDGGDLIDFAGWASFVGRISAPAGIHNPPPETAGDASGDAWEGRRPPSTASFPGGAAGGFRFAPQTFTPIPNGLEGSPGLPFEGRAASVSQGGFLFDQSPDLEVFRGSFVIPAAGTFLLRFEVDQIQYFAPGQANPIIITDPSFESVGATYRWIPTPGSAWVLGFGLLGFRRRR